MSNAATKENNMTTELCITSTSDGTFRIDTANGVTVDRNISHIAQVAADLLPLSYVANSALYMNLLNAMKKGANLITVDVEDSDDGFGRECDVHVSRHGVLVEAFIITHSGGFAPII